MRKEKNVSAYNLGVDLRRMQDHVLIFRLRRFFKQAQPVELDGLLREASLSRFREDDLKRKGI